jgi:hypothetical protein
VAINYVGHAEKWEAMEIDGSLDARLRRGLQERRSHACYRNHLSRSP